MMLRQIVEPTLSQFAYLVGCEERRSAILIDPQRDIDLYLRVAEHHRVRIEAVVDTHIHADYVSGVRQFAEQEGVTVYASGAGVPGTHLEWLDRASAPHRLLAHGDRIEVGRVVLEAVHTPGHSPEHLSFLIYDTTRTDSAPVAVATGDFVFAGDVGRPDLMDTLRLPSGDATAWAEALFESLQAFRKLPPELLLLPGHGAGSACGRSLAPATTSTVGREVSTNPSVLAARDRQAFVEYILEDQPEAPSYFARVKQLNRQGPPVLTRWPMPERVDVRALSQRIADPDCTVIDTRPWEEYRRGHLAGSLFVPLTAAFSTLVASYAPPGSRVSFVADPLHLDEITRQCIRVGIDDLDAFISPQQLRSDDGRSARLTLVPEINMAELRARMAQEPIQLVDVRHAAELNLKPAIAGARNIAHTQLADRLQELPDDTEWYVYCNSGNRSRYATALLASRGYRVTHVMGGIEAWIHLSSPVPAS